MPQLKTLIILLLCATSLLPLPLRGQTAGSTEGNDSRPHDFWNSSAQIDSDSLQISLLTCSSGQKAYDLYGHTALLVESLNNGPAWVFNYGVYNFNKPNFVWHFILGKNEYEIGIAPKSLFIGAYLREGRSVSQQVFNLSQPEARRIAKALIANYMLEDWTYAYDFYRDNCTTRAIDILPQNGIAIDFHETQRLPVSFRSLLHQLTGSSPWTTFGNDILLGTGADKPTYRSRMVLPTYAEAELEAATIGSPANHSLQKLVIGTHTYEPAVTFEPSKSAISPEVAGWIAIIVTLALTLFEWWRGKRLRLFDASLMLVQGLGGCVIFILFFFSTHSFVDSNWNILWLNPLPLIALPLLWAERKPFDTLLRAYCIMEIVCIAGVVFVVNALNLQYIPLALTLMAQPLLIRAVWNLLCPPSLNRTLATKTSKKP